MSLHDEQVERAEIARTASAQYRAEDDYADAVIRNGMAELHGLTSEPDETRRVALQCATRLYQGKGGYAAKVVKVACVFEKYLRGEGDAVQERQTAEIHARETSEDREEVGQEVRQARREEEGA